MSTGRRSPDGHTISKPVWKRSWTFWAYAANILLFLGILLFGLLVSSGDLWQLLVRLPVMSTIITVAYDRRVYRPRMARAHGSESERADVERRHAFVNWMAPWGLVWLVAVGVAVVLILR